MNIIKVPCWEFSEYDKKTNHYYLLYVTYPEDNAGYDLISCLNCGQLYAVNVTTEVYIGPPLDQKLKGLSCISCGKELQKTFDYYPNKYLAKDGRILTFTKPFEIPPDNESKLIDLPAIYD